ncbi:MAG: hypothetical protein NTV12_10060 [Verrucomicrobia bacterium]|nr:hypothetical protein [Verrucomicrobiota bacterium]
MSELIVPTKEIISTCGTFFTSDRVEGIDFVGEKMLREITIAYDLKSIGFNKFVEDVEGIVSSFGSTTTGALVASPV